MQETIINFIKEEIHPEDPGLEIEPDDDLLGTGLLGSMEMMRLVQYLEEKYEFRVAPEDMAIENFMTVEAMTDYVNRVKKR